MSKLMSSREMKFIDTAKGQVDMIELVVRNLPIEFVPSGSGALYEKAIVDAMADIHSLKELINDFETGFPEAILSTWETPADGVV